MTSELDSCQPRRNQTDLGLTEVTKSKRHFVAGQFFATHSFFDLKGHRQRSPKQDEFLRHSIQLGRGK